MEEEEIVQQASSPCKNSVCVIIKKDKSFESMFGCKKCQYHTGRRVRKTNFGE